MQNVLKHDLKERTGNHLERLKTHDSGNEYLHTSRRNSEVTCKAGGPDRKPCNLLYFWYEKRYLLSQS